MEGHCPAMKVGDLLQKDGRRVSFLIPQDAAPADLVNAPMGTKFMIAYALYTEEERNPAKLTAKERYAAKTPEEQAVADAAMLAKDASFQMWATERAYALGLKFETAKDFIHDRCAVASCAEFAADPRAFQRWNGFRAGYDEWRRG